MSNDKDYILEEIRRAAGKTVDADLAKRLRKLTRDDLCQLRDFIKSATDTAYVHAEKNAAASYKRIAGGGT